MFCGCYLRNKERAKRPMLPQACLEPKLKPKPDASVLNHVDVVQAQLGYEIHISKSRPYPIASSIFRSRNARNIYERNWEYVDLDVP